MTRAEAKQKLMDFGIAEPTEAQITAMLDTISTETKALKSKAEDLKTVTGEKEALAQQVEDLNKQFADLQKQHTTAEVKAILAAGGMKEDEYAGFINGFIAGDLETSKAMANAFVKTISDTRTAEAERVKAEYLNNTKGLGGSGGSGQGGDNKPEDLQNAENIVFGGLAKGAQSARDFYK